MTDTIGYPQPGSTEDDQATGPASKRYWSLQYDREPFLIRGRRCSRLTDPTLYREIGENSTTTETLPWQSLGAAGINNLATKLVDTMFPVATPWAKFDPSAAALKSVADLPADQRGAWNDAVRAGLAKEQQEFLKCIAQDGDRDKLFDAARHQIVGGNHGLKLNRKKAILQSIRLERYVNIRDNWGCLQEFVVEDGMSRQTLPEDIQRMIQAKTQAQTNDPKQLNAEKSINVYTHGKMIRDGVWELRQECYGEEVPGSRETLDDDVMPYLFLRMIALEKENYGRSYCEGNEADLQTLDGYYQFLTEAGASIAQLKWSVKPGGSTNKKAFAEAANGAVITGDPDDVTAIKAEKGGDLQFSMEMLDRVEKRLERAFIMTQGIQRDAERVTAEEIQLMSQELDATLGGVYSNLSTAWQYPYAIKKLGVLQRTGRLTKLPKGLVTVAIRSGEDALADKQEAQSLDRVLTNAAAALNPQSAALPYIDIHGYLSRQFAKEGIDTDGLLKSEADVQAAALKAQQDAMTANVAPEMVKQGGALLQNHQQNIAAAAAAPPPTPQAQPQGAS